MKRILIEIGHPAHVHQFKNMYWELEKLGWTGLFVTKDKECAIDLLKAYKLPYEVLGITKQGMAAKILSLPYFAGKMLRVAMRFEPDIFISRVSPLSGWSSFILRKPHITFTDTENVKLMDSISQPFADIILTSYAYLRDHGRKQLRYPGTHELAYLHPNWFIPDPSVLDSLGVRAGEKYSIIRYISWSAHHDIGHGGLTPENKLTLIDSLSKYSRVFISSEGELPAELEPYRITIDPEQMLSALHYAALFIGEGATMAEECSVLGTPSILITSCPKGGVIVDLERFKLMDFFTNSPVDQEKAIELAVKYARSDDIKTAYRHNRQKMLQDLIDVSSFMVWFVDEYPNSLKEMKTKVMDFSAYRIKA
ncbi:MAG: DUF354 domain-containing protein [Methanosarcina sp.]|nr:DUF354 domain-containing protein [Methanosarcina sp.]